MVFCGAVKLVGKELFEGAKLELLMVEVLGLTVIVCPVVGE
jgi:hypothetical protein